MTTSTDIPRSAHARRRLRRLSTLLLAVAGCIPAPSQRGPSDVAQVVVRLGDGRPGHGVVPGERVPLRVLVKDGKGRSYTRTSGALGAGRIQVRTHNVRYDAASQTVEIPLDLEARIARGERVGVEVAVGGKVERVDFALDTDRARGPRVADVAALRLTLAETEPLRFVIPHTAPALSLQVIDASGRRYGIGAAAPGVIPLPKDRFQLSVQGLRYDESTGELRLDDESESARDAPCSLELVILPRADEADATPRTAQVRVIPDFNMLLGPRPEDVRQVRLQLAAQGVPGAVLPVQIEVLDEHERWLPVRTAGASLGVPLERLDIRTVRADFNTEQSALVLGNLDADDPTRPYDLAVSYLGSNTTTSASVLPDLAQVLASVLKPVEPLRFEGPEGESGVSGEPGQDGASGASDASQYGTGQPGKSGTNGTDGQPGREGGNGDIIEVAAALFEIVDGSRRVLVVGVKHEHERTVRAYALDGGPLTIAATGGRGGSGGAGGPGGNGGHGGNGWSNGNGGDGGMGGRGGVGGMGGRGGEIHALVADPSVLSHLTLEAPGGEGGPGGKGGAGGAAGPSGTSAVQMTSYFGKEIRSALSGQGTSSSAPPRTPGSAGEPGPSGSDGKQGARGARGVVDVQDEPAVAAMLHAALPRNAAALLRPLNAAGAASGSWSALFAAHTFDSRGSNGDVYARKRQEQALAEAAAESERARRNLSAERAYRDQERAVRIETSRQLYEGLQEMNRDLERTAARIREDNAEVARIQENIRRNNEQEARERAAAAQARRAADAELAEQTRLREAELRRIDEEARANAQSASSSRSEGSAAAAASSATQAESKPAPQTAAAAAAPSAGESGSASAPQATADASSAGKSESATAPPAAAAPAGPSPSQLARDREFHKFCDYARTHYGSPRPVPAEVSKLGLLMDELAQAAAMKDKGATAEDPNLRAVVERARQRARELETQIDKLIKHERDLHWNMPFPVGKRQLEFKKNLGDVVNDYNLTGTARLRSGARDLWLGWGAQTLRSDLVELQKLKSALTKIRQPYFGPYESECRNEHAPAD